MHLDDYVRQVHEQLGATAALGDERTQQIAATLTAAAAPAVRLAIMAALGEAADEITAALLDSPGGPTVSLRLDGDDVRVEVVSGEPTPMGTRADDGDASARISLRLSEQLKADVEQAAGVEGLSVNTWLVRAAGNALTPTWSPVSSVFGVASGHGGRNATGGKRGTNSHRVTGWING
ncbi:MAG: toxin-antitoxin system HicB family antitoxin [Jatrophihabitantaceae bacterium]